MLFLKQTRSQFEKWSEDIKITFATVLTNIEPNAEIYAPNLQSLVEELRLEWLYTYNKTDS